jgi:hypothetical protein
MITVLKLLLITYMRGFTWYICHFKFISSKTHSMGATSKAGTAYLSGELKYIGRSIVLVGFVLLSH